MTAVQRVEIFFNQEKKAHFFCLLNYFQLNNSKTRLQCKHLIGSLLEVFEKV